MAEPMPLASTKERYRLLEKIGSGGMGVVYRAQDRLNEQILALKSLLIKPSSLTFNTRHDETNHAVALAHEFRMLASLRHPHIISVLDYGFDAEQMPFFTMSFLEDYRPINQYARTFSLTQRVQLLRDLLQALAYLHRHGIVHRDLKPANILISPEGELKVLDFGLALRDDKQERKTVGTLAYMAPETLRGGVTSFTSDLYSVGTIAYELLAGYYPFASDNITNTMIAILGEAPDFSAIDAPLELTIIIQRLLQKDPQDRYQDALSVYHALQPFSGEASDEVAYFESYLTAARFVGRTQELEQLGTQLEAIQTSEPRGSAWLIGGESGVGKSRMVDELRSRALVAGAFVLRGQGVAEGGLPYHAWREVLRPLILIAQPPDEIASVLKAIVPDIERLLERPVPDIAELTGNASQDRLVSAIVATFKLVKRPMVLVLEDIHWMQESIAPLHRLSQQVKNLPLLILGTYRKDERPDLPVELSAMALMTLEPLSESDVHAMSAAIIGERVTPDFSDMLLRETQGNAFFIVEVVRALAEDAGSISRLGQMTLPDSIISGGIHEVLLRRLERVPEHYRDALALAAVNGRRINQELLAHILPELKLDDFLFQMTEAAIIAPDGETWRFSHDKLREALLSQLQDERLVTLSRRVALAMEELYADELNSYAPLLAQHWRTVGDLARESAYLLPAAEVAMDNVDYAQALALYERSLAIEAHQYAQQPEIQHAETLRLIGSVYENKGELLEALEYYERAFSAFCMTEDTYSIVKSQNNVAEMLIRIGTYSSAHDLFERSLAMAEALDNKELIGYTLMGLGNLANFMEKRELALEYREKCHDILKEIGSPLDLARALNNWANTLDILGKYDEAIAKHEEALAIRQRLQDRYGVATTYTNLAALNAELKEDDKARDYAYRAIRIGEQIGASIFATFCYSTLGIIAMRHEDYEEARRCYIEARNIAEQQHMQQNLFTLEQNLGYAERKMGNFEKALGHYSKALTYMRELDFMWSRGFQALWYSGLCLKALGRIEEAGRIVGFLKGVPMPSNIQELTEADIEAVWRAMGTPQAHPDDTWEKLFEIIHMTNHEHE